MSRKWKWLAIPVFIYLGYSLSVILSIVPLTILKINFPNNDIVSYQYDRYNISGIKDIYSYRAFIWVFTSVIWYNIGSSLIKLIKNFYESQQDKLRILQERNIMELNFLRAQIQPHFLFNTLNNIYGMVLDHDKASQSILRLSDLLRFSLHKSNKADITLEEEITFLTNYISLEKMRHKESRVSIDYNFEEVEQASRRIKPLLLVNFIENAFKHGVNASARDAWMTVWLREHDGLLTFHAANNRSGATMGKKPRKEDGENGVGLTNVRRRLELEYPDQHTLSIKETADKYEVELVLKL